MASISGVTKINGVESSCTVRMYNRGDGSLEYDLTSNESGIYAVTHLFLDEYPLGLDIVCIGSEDVCPQISGPIIPQTTGVFQSLTWSSDSPSNWGFTHSNKDVSNISSSSAWHKVNSDISRSSTDGSYYYEVYLNVGGNFAIGIANAGTPTVSSQGGDNNAGDGNRYQYFQDGRKRINGTYSAYGDTYSAGDYIGVSIHSDGGSTKVHFYKNGVDQGEAFSLSEAIEFEPHICTYGNSGINFLSLDDIEFKPESFNSWNIV